MRKGFEQYYNGDEATGTRLLSFPNAGHYVLLLGVYDSDNGRWQWKRDYYGAKPTRERLKSDIEGLINDLTDDNILRGYVWKDNPVWLSSENQFNFKAAYDLAFQTNGASLPARYKLGEDKDGNPIYYDFEDLATFQDFYLGAITWIQKCINAGWEEKDAVDYDKLLNQ